MAIKVSAINGELVRLRYRWPGATASDIQAALFKYPHLAVKGTVDNQGVPILHLSGPLQTLHGDFDCSFWIPIDYPVAEPWVWTDAQGGCVQDGTVVNKEQWGSEVKTLVELIDAVTQVLTESPPEVTGNRSDGSAQRYATQSRFDIVAAWVRTKSSTQAFKAYLSLVALTVSVNSSQEQMDQLLNICFYLCTVYHIVKFVYISYTHGEPHQQAAGRRSRAPLRRA
eukprot:TRINITY_DN65229_c0_g1_i1.p1 TRINITY_DN65229_c0_g1~~TRINITY_DN65229_c0_g1_i1.p1  ORF type:complete len:252 (+),score=72.67 TRINITY_DN65229_c0_g1_i1:79-756(+)